MLYRHVNQRRLSRLEWGVSALADGRRDRKVATLCPTPTAPNGSALCDLLHAGRPGIGRRLRRAFRASASRGSNEFMKLQVSVASEVGCRSRQFLVADRAIQNCDARKSAHRIRPNPRCPDTPIVTDSSNQLSSGTKEKHRQMALHHLCRGRAFRLVNSTRIQPIGSPGADIAPVKERRRVWVARGARRARHQSHQ